MQLETSLPFDWQRLASFFSGRATPGVEVVDGDTYHRTLDTGDGHVVVSVRPGDRPEHLSISINGGTDEVKCALATQARTVFDLDAPIDEIRDVLRADRVLSGMLERNAGVRVPGAWEPFELTVRAILGQQISVKAATTLAGRIAQRYGAPLTLDRAAGGLNRLFPTAERLARARFRDIGIVRSRAQTIRDLSSAVVGGDICFTDGTTTETRQALESIRGIGSWTSQYVAMRALRDPDAFPGSDLGLVSAIAHPDRVSPKELVERANAWRPWRAYAAMLLWNSLPGSGG